MEHKADVIIFGAGIAGLWLNSLLKSKGYNSLLLETQGVGGLQSVNSQGILHSGLKYSFAGKINALAQSISAMPDRWKSCLDGHGEIDLQGVSVNARSQMLMIPTGIMGGITKLITQKALGKTVAKVDKDEWPDDLRNSGFKGDLIYMNEPVLDVPGLVAHLAKMNADSIRHINWDDVTVDTDSVTIRDHVIQADHIIFTAAATNQDMAKKLGHDKGLKTQKRPLLMGMLRPAPFKLYAHLVGQSDKPVVTITTHVDQNGQLIWYLGGQTAERAKESPIAEMKDFALKALKKYMPNLDFSDVEWTAYPVDRVEGKSNTEGWMPDTPVVHTCGNVHYCWPTKLTFAPMLGDKILDKLTSPAQNTASTWDFLPPAPLAATAWNHKND